MNRNRLLSALLAAAAFGLNLGQGGTIGVSAAYAESEALRAEISKPLQAAQDMLKNKRYKEALAKVQEADAVGSKTPYEIYILERMRGSAAIGAGDIETAAKAFDAVIKSGRLAEDEQTKLMEALAGAYYRAKDYGKAAKWAQRYVQANGASEQMRNLLIYSHYLGHDYASAAKALESEFQADDKAGRTPNEERLRLLGDSYAQLGDNAGYAKVLERLVAHYPKKEYWADLLARVQRNPAFADRLALDLFRLQLATGNLTAANHYMEMTQLALQAGLPAEAKKVIEKGYESGTLGKGADADRHKRLYDMVKARFAEDQKALGEGDAQAEAARNGVALVNTGFNYVVNGMLDKGIPMMERGIAKDGLKRPEEDKLHLGIAYIQAGHKEKAARILKSVQGNDGTADLARLWSYVR